MIWLIFLFNFLIFNPISAQWISCYDSSCPLKNVTFSTTSSSSIEGDSSKSDLFYSAYKTDSFGNLFYFTLSAYQFPSTFDRTIATSMTEDGSAILFTCSAPSNTVELGYPTISGTSIMFGTANYCSWTIEINNGSFPFDLIDPPKYYISDSGYQIYYDFDQTIPAPSANYSELPENLVPFIEGYQYEAVGSEKYLLISRIANNSNDFILQVNDQIPELVEINLKSNIGLSIECNFDELTVRGFAKYGQVSSYLYGKLLNEQIGDNQCQWSLPDTIDTLYGPVQVTKTSFELEIVENKRFVYFDQSDFRLPITSASSTSTLAKSLLIVMVISLIFSH